MNTTIAPANLDTNYLDEKKTLLSEHTEDDEVDLTTFETTGTNQSFTVERSVFADGFTEGASSFANEFEPPRNQMHTLAYFATFRKALFEQLSHHPLVQQFLENKWMEMRLGVNCWIIIPKMFVHVFYMLTIFLIYSFSRPEEQGWYS